MARREHGAAETLQELESASDRLSDWLEENIRGVVAAVVGVLVLAGAFAWWSSADQSEEEGASTALAKVRADYLSAMGVDPGSLEVPELANPVAASQIRTEYQERFSQVAGEHPGTVAGTLAGLEAATLAARDGRGEEAQGLVDGALASAPDGSVRGLAQQRLAQIYESQERWSEASEAHLAASEVGDYPLRGFALADAARTRAQAGDAAAALALYERFEREYEGLQLPAHQQLELAELRAAAAQ